jgi:hypothetical protein
VFKEHPVFKLPSDGNVAIWRYMDFAKFVNVLDRSALYFCRSDRLGDPFEGSYSKAMVGKPSDTAMTFLQTIKGDEKASLIRSQILESQSKLRRGIRRCALVNCWHMNNVESAAMWNLYVRNNKGVAIRSSFNKLKNCLAREKLDVYIGEVEYVDYQDYEWPRDNYLYPLLHKRKSFEHEHELRAMIVEFPTPREAEVGLEVRMPIVDYGRPRFRYGVEARVDLDTLIDTIYVAPTSRKWLYRLVESLTKRYKLSKEVCHSALDIDAVF